MLVNEVRTAQQAYFAALDDFLKFQSELMQQSADDTEATCRRPDRRDLGLGVIALVVGVSRPAWIVRNLSRQLGGEPDACADLARAVAQGDLTVRIDLRPATAPA
jgi:methyl-accepting chemotaxis protein